MVVLFFRGGGGLAFVWGGKSVGVMESQVDGFLFRASVYNVRGAKGAMGLLEFARFSFVDGGAVLVGGSVHVWGLVSYV